MSAAKPREGAYNFNESCDPDIVSVSLPYMEGVFTNCTLSLYGMVAALLYEMCMYGVRRSYSPMGFMGSW